MNFNSVTTTTIQGRGSYRLRYFVGTAVVLCLLWFPSSSRDPYNSRSTSDATFPKSTSNAFYPVDGCVQIPEQGHSMSKRTSIPQRLEDVYLKLDGYLDQHAPLKNGKWQNLRPEGVAANHLGGKKVTFLWDAIKRHVPRCRTVCEVGLNAGHSSVLWMEACPEATAVLFDLPYKSWSQATFDFLRTHYEGRITITEGNSLVTIPEYLEKHPGTQCDIIAIDGSKEAAVRFHDFLNLEQYAHPATLLLLDDASIEQIQARLSTQDDTRGPNDFIGTLRMSSYDLNDLYASLLTNHYIWFQGGCSVSGAMHNHENSTISAFYSRLKPKKK